MLAPRRIRALIWLTVGLGAGTYCIAEADAALALVAMMMWALAWPVSFGRLGKPLPKSIISLIILAALAYSTLRIVNDRHDLVIAVSRLLLWLQLVKLYDRISRRDRGVLLTMSVFLVIGATLTSNSLWLGAALVVYAPVCLWTVVVHQLGAIAEACAGSGSVSRRSALNCDPHVHPRHNSEDCATCLGVSRGLRRSLVRLSGAMALGSLAIAAGVFVLVPRGVGEGFLGAWGAPARLAKTGFNDSVTLGSAGLLSVSKTPVLDLFVYDAAGRNIGSADRTFLLRGAVLDHYDHGRWTRGEASARRDVQVNVQAETPQPLFTASAQRSIYRLEITLHRRPNEHLFTMMRPVSITLARSGRLTFGRSDDELAYTGGGALRYSVRVQPESDSAADRSLTPAFTQGRIHELAASLLASADVPVEFTARSPEQQEQAADALVDYLRRNYTYTLEMIGPGVDEDPIEMFLFRTREGHCEYFASAMTAMCRSVGIDARVVTGYMAVEFNKDSGAYTVRESNAHAWVEVRLAGGRWVTFDPSPPDDLSLVHEPPTGLAASVRSFMDSVSRWWINSVVGFNESRRAALVGQDPLMIQAVSERVLDDALLPTKPGGKPILLIALLRGAIVFALTASLGFVLAHLAGLISVRRRQQRDRRARFGNDAAARLRQLSFYTRMIRALRRADLAKPAWRPPRAHAETLRSVDEPLADAVGLIAELYYVSRFGGRELTTDELSRADRCLARVSERLATLRS